MHFFIPSLHLSTPYLIFDQLSSVHILLQAIAISTGLILATNNVVRCEACELLQNFKVYASTDQYSARMYLQMIQSPQLVLE